MSLVPPVPAGGFSSTKVEFKNGYAQKSVTPGAPVNVDSLSYTNSVLVLTSRAQIGTWQPNGSVTENGKWDYFVGNACQVPTQHHSTSYTFPGYSGANAQVQFANAIPIVSNVGGKVTDVPPKTWHVDNTATNGAGYYGVVGGPTFVVHWTVVNT
jgi:hypothetical protein